MKLLKIVAITLITISLVACKKDVKNSDGSIIIESISLEELKVLGNDIQLIDVRTPKEFASGYIKNAININISDKTFLEGTVLLDKSKPVYVYCVKGARSTTAATELQKAGFTKVYNYKGGFREWVKKGNTISMY